MRALLCSAAFGALASPALAATVAVDFDGAWPVATSGYATTVLDDGFLAETANLYWSGDDILLHDDGGITRTVLRRADGGRFSPVSIELRIASWFERAGGDPRPDDDAGFSAVYDWATAGLRPLATYRITGRKADGSTVVTDGGPSPSATLSFGRAFADVTELGFEIVYPPGVAEDGVLTRGIAVSDLAEVIDPGQVWCMDYCASLVLDNFAAGVAQDDVPAPIPLPASVLMLGAGLAALGTLRRRA